MASFRKINGRWQAQIARKGVRKSKLFDSKQLAKDWANREEHLILSGATQPGSVIMSEVLDRYGREVSSTKRGAVWEYRRIGAFQRQDFAAMPIGSIEAKDITAWRDKRLREVAGSTVGREWNLLSNVFSVAMREWGLIDKSPMTTVRRPKDAPPRDRLVTEAELEALAISAGDDLTNATARVFHSFLFAIETAMRAGEIISLTWDNVDLEKRVAFLPRTKNGTSRHVPLSSEAVRLLKALPYADPIFDLDDSSRDALWRKLRDRAGVVGLRFHDSRASAVSRLAKKLDILDLARMVGHRDVRMLMVYYRDSAEEIAKRLD